MGQTWDETAYVMDGYTMINLLIKGDFTNKHWYDYPDHPPLAKYMYGLASLLDKDGTFDNGKPSFVFDYNFMRLVSVFCAALSAALLFLLTRKYFSNKVAILAAIIFMLLPRLIGLNQLVTLESPKILFYIATILAFMGLLEKPSNRRIILVGILLGLTLSVKLTNILILPILFGSLFIYAVRHKMQKEEILKIFLILPISFITFFAIWPALWFRPIETLKHAASIRIPQLGLGSLFLGKYDAAPFYYYIVYFFITTPLLIVLFFLIGLKDLLRKPNWQFLTIVLWFFVPFLLSFYNLKQGGIRYVIEIYPALAILAALGVDWAAKKFSEHGFVLLYFLVPIYLLVSCLLISPYYLDYFNSLAGGTVGVYQNRTFELGWWGEGQREATLFLSHNAVRGNRVGVYVVPKYLIPPIDGLTFEFYNPKKNYDYLMVNYLALINARLDYSIVPSNYQPVYTVEAQGAPIVVVFRRITH